ncbi:hypothetical protein AAG747_09330 [Rapidithrix thailandica]|uniref:Uncharacterized protein n=1 Tax=Rapidithrix thailandica TaxID=413964 RepID=A0AAW9RT70_9BACT
MKLSILVYILSALLCFLMLLMSPLRAQQLLNIQDVMRMENQSDSSQLQLSNKRLKGDIAYNFGKVKDYESNQGNLDFENERYRINHVLALSANYQLLKEKDFYIRLGFNFPINPNINAPWINSEYTYALGKYSYSPGSWSYGYFNTEIKKYREGIKGFTESLSRGSFFVNYRPKLPSSWFDWLKTDPSASLSMELFVQYAIHYLNAIGQQKGGLSEGKAISGLGFRYICFKHIYLEAKVYYYPRSGTQFSWDPDFTYGFGFADWRPFKISCTYGNWAGENRFSRNRGASPASFWEGSFRLGFTYQL